MDIIPEKQQVVLSLVGRATPETRTETKMLAACNGFPWAGSDWDTTRKELLSKHRGDAPAAAAEYSEKTAVAGSREEGQEGRTDTESRPSL